MRYGTAAAWLIAGAVATLPGAQLPAAFAEGAAAGTVSSADSGQSSSAQAVGNGTKIAGTAMDEAAWEAALAAGAAVSAVHGTVAKEPASEGTASAASANAATANGSAAPVPAVRQGEQPSEPLPSPSSTTSGAPAADAAQTAESKQSETHTEKAALMPHTAERVKALMQKFKLSGDPKSGAYRWMYTSPTWTAEAVSRPAAGSSYFLLAGAESLRFQSLDCDEVWYFHEGCGMKMTVLLVDGTVHTFELGLGGQAMPMILLPKGQIFAAENIDPAGYSFISCMMVPTLDARGIRVWQREELLVRYPQAKDWIERYTDAPSERATLAGGVSGAAEKAQPRAAGEAAAASMPQTNAGTQAGGEIRG